MFLHKIQSVMFGSAVGDALGVPVVRKNRGDLDKDPVTGMRSFGSYNLPAGCFSDDTSMSLATLDSLANGHFDLADIMAHIGKWAYHGAYSTAEKAFGMDKTCRTAIVNYFARSPNPETCGLSDAESNTSGSIVRIHPVVMYNYAHPSLSSFEETNNVDKACALTHANNLSKLGCRIYSLVLGELLGPVSETEMIYKGLEKAYKYYKNDPDFKAYAKLFTKNFTETDRSEIPNGNGVADTLEAALWCVLTSENYEQSLLKAVNLGGNADSIGAVTGAIAGAVHGLADIPTEWLVSLRRKGLIDGICKKAFTQWNNED